MQTRPDYTSHVDGCHGQQLVKVVVSLAISAAAVASWPRGPGLQEMSSVMRNSSEERKPKRTGNTGAHLEN